MKYSVVKLEHFFHLCQCKALTKLRICNSVCERIIIIITIIIIILIIIRPIYTFRCVLLRDQAACWRHSVWSNRDVAATRDLLRWTRSRWSRRLPWLEHIGTAGTSTDSVPGQRTHTVRAVHRGAIERERVSPALLMATAEWLAATEPWRQTDKMTVNVNHRESYLSVCRYRVMCVVVCWSQRRTHLHLFNIFAFTGCDFCYWMFVRVFFTGVEKGQHECSFCVRVDPSRPPFCGSVAANHSAVVISNTGETRSRSATVRFNLF